MVLQELPLHFICCMVSFNVGQVVATVFAALLGKPDMAHHRLQYILDYT